MKILPLHTPPNPYAVHQSFYRMLFPFSREANQSGTFSFRNRSSSDIHGDPNYINFEQIVNRFSHRYIKKVYNNRNSSRANHAFVWQIFCILPNFTLYQDIGTSSLQFDRKRYFSNRPWIEKTIRQNRDLLNREEYGEYSPLDEQFFQGAENNDYFYHRYTLRLCNRGCPFGILVCENLLHRLLLFLSKKYYGSCSFNTNCKSNRLFYYFEFLDNTFQKNHNPLINFDDNFYFKTNTLMLNKTLVIPVFYFHPKQLGNVNFKFDLLELPKGLTFKYLNYHKDYSLVLGFVDVQHQYQSLENLPPNTPNFFFYTNWKYVQAYFIEKKRSSRNNEPSIRKRINFNSPILHTPKFISKYSIEGGHTSGIEKSEIMDIIVKSGLTINQTNFPKSFPSNLTDERNQFYWINREIGISAENRASRISYDTLKNMLIEYYLDHGPLASQERVQKSLARISKHKKLQYLDVDNIEHRVEWQDICRHISKEYKFDRLKEIAQKTYKIEPHHLEVLTKRQLCKLLAHLTSLNQVKAMKSWSANRKEGAFKIPDGICSNYSEEPDIRIEISDIIPKLYDPSTHEITEEDLVRVKDFLKKTVGTSDETISEIRNHDITLIKTLISSWENSLKSYKETTDYRYFVIVRPDLISSCVSFDSLTYAEEQNLCAWRLKAGRTATVTGDNFEPNRSEKIYPIPFKDPDLEEIDGVSDTIMIDKKGFRRIKNKIDDEELVSRLQNEKKVMVFYLGNKPKESRTGNCQGWSGVAMTHGQLHSLKAIYPVVYSREIDPVDHAPVEDEDSGEDETKPETKENPEVRARLDEIAQQEAVIIRRQQTLSNELKDANESYETDGHGYDKEDFFRQHFPHLVEKLIEYQNIESQKRRFLVEKMRLRPRLNTPAT